MTKPVSVPSSPTTYSVNLWGSKPGENDDCWTGADFSTLEEARAVLADPWSHFSRSYHESSTAYFELDGPDVNEITKNPSFKPRKQRDDGEWRREAAMQAGMMGGVECYNDAMGF